MGKYPGVPETEKLLMHSNIFEVSVDYLLKESNVLYPNNEKGYYVNREVAESYILNDKRLLNILNWDLAHSSYHTTYVLQKVSGNLDIFNYLYFVHWIWYYIICYTKRR